MADDGPRYGRALLKLSGAYLAGPASAGIDFEVAGRLCDELVAAHGLGVQLGIVFGGGNILRGADTDATGLDRVTRDHMGMLGTVINALAVQALLEKRGVAARVMTAVPMAPVAEPFDRSAAIGHLQMGRVVLFAAGTGHPFFTTDTAAALRAREIGADVLLKGTNVDGVYSADPRKAPDAVRYETLNYSSALSNNLRVMDAAAFALCREGRIPILVFNLSQPGNIVRVLQGEPLGTLVHGN